ncbi:MAG: lytic transglycosylase domain-containing protein, partial [bacterium]|nr:lytic transglycosylase domain-containing protein [bacterium]
MRVAGMVCVCSAALPGQNSEMQAQRWADRYAAVYSVPAELVHAIIEIESGWRPDAVSTKGAVGLMQLMPATAAAFGVRDRYDVEQNIRGGVAYLAHLMQQFRGELRLV